MGSTGEIAQPDMDPVIQHFSHHHPLKLQNFRPETTNAFICAACKLEPSGAFYFCSICNYCLHKTCSYMPRSKVHRVDSKHTLVLLSSPAYATGSFKCNACGKLGAGFCYHCKHCRLDIHTLCIDNPSSVNVSTHLHTLELCFTPPYSRKKFKCDICKKSGSNHWLYRCGACNYDVHMNCALSNQLQPAQGIQQTQILRPTDSADTQFQSVREQLVCQANAPQGQLQAVIGVQQTEQNQPLCNNALVSIDSQLVAGIRQTLEQKLRHSISANIYMQTIRTNQVPQTHEEQLLGHSGIANSYAQPVSGILQAQQQPQLLKSRSYPPRFLNSSSITSPKRQMYVQYVQAPDTPKPGHNLMDHMVQELVDGFIQQAGGAIFRSLASGDLPFDLNISDS